MTAAVDRCDAMHFLGRLPDESIDATITDPPYSSGGAFRSDRSPSAKTKYLTTRSRSLERLPEFYGDNRTERGLLLWSSLWLSEAWRVTKPGGAIAVFTDWRSLPTFSDALQSGGWSWRGIGVWVKPTGKSRPTLGGLWNDTEYVLWGSKGSRTSGECLPGTWQCAGPASATRLHVTEKPHQILNDLVRLAPPDGTVLDPFAGSGSTAVAAIIQGRRFVGCELSTEYVEIANRRVSAVISHGTDLIGHTAGLFDLTSEVPA